LPKQPFIIPISSQIITNIPTTLSIQGIESNLLPKQLFVAIGFNQFFSFCSPLSAQQIGAITIMSWSWNPTLPTKISYLL
jgi:hypothetical protein